MNCSYGRMIDAPATPAQPSASSVSEWAHAHVRRRWYTAAIWKERPDVKQTLH